MQTLTISTSKGYKEWFHAEVTVEEAREAVSWLVAHNGGAPKTAQILLIGLQTAILQASEQ